MDVVTIKKRVGDCIVVVTIGDVILGLAILDKEEVVIVILDKEELVLLILDKDEVGGDSVAEKVEADARVDTEIEDI